MTVWLDAHFSPDLALWLGRLCRETCKTLREIDLEAASDQELFEAAGRFGQVVIFTKDHDFVELLHRLGAPPSVIWLRCPNMRDVRRQSVLKETFVSALEQIRQGAPLVEITISKE